jgi:hypothetical protein
VMECQARHSAIMQMLDFQKPHGYKVDYSAHFLYLIKCFVFAHI